MEKCLALNALSALANGIRLDILRLLVAEGPAGMPAGRIARRVGVSASGLSFHLTVMEQAGLIASCREGRYLRYRVNHARLGALMSYLLNDCCMGHPEICARSGAEAARPVAAHSAAGSPSGTTKT